MAITLEKLYREVKGFEIKLLAGKRGIKNIVRWIHMVENTEIANFLQGGEIVFTTGIGLNNKTDLLDLIKENKRNNASGIIINIGPYINEIPQEVIDYCEENDFPLFTVPWKIRLSQIMRIFSKEILQSEQVNLELSTAMKNAIFSKEDGSLYLNTFEKYGFMLDWPYSVTIIEFNNIDKKKKMTIRIDIENRLIFLNEKFFIFEINSLFIIVLGKCTDVRVKEIIKDIVTSIEEKYKNIIFYIGIGQTTKTADCIYKSYANAKNVLKLNKSLGDNNRILNYNDLGLYKVLLSIDDNTIIKKYCDETLGKLIKFDLVNSTDYIGFLRVYLQNNCNSIKTSENLYIHRNTVNYKVHKIEDILGCDLGEMETRTNLYTAFMLINLI